MAAATGFLSFFLLWVTAMWGITLRSGWALTSVRHSTLYGTHMTLSIFGLVLGLVHAGAQLAVPLGPVAVIDEFVPFTNNSDPIGVGFGTISLEIFIALIISVPLQKKLGYHRWRGMHALAYLAFTLVTAHALISGSDMGPVYAYGPVVAAWVITVVYWIATMVGAGVAKVPGPMGEKINARQNRARQVTVNVDPSHCVRFGFCEHEAPEVFQLRTDGRLTYKAAVPADQVEAVIQAAQVCPARAIMLTRQPTTVVMNGQPQSDGPRDDGPRKGPRPVDGPSRPTRIGGSSRHGGRA